MHSQTNNSSYGKVYTVKNNGTHHELILLKLFPVGVYTIIDNCTDSWPHAWPD